MFNRKNHLALAACGLLSPVAYAAAQDAAAQGAPMLPSITVHASRFEEKLTDALPQTSIVSSEDILKSGASNVSEVLSKVAGLPTRINLDGSTNAVIDMRGYGDTADNNVVVLLDGVRLSENEQTAARTSMIPLEAIDHIEITRGGNSVLYGDGATGGTINIVTKKRAGNMTVATAGVTSYSGFQSSIFHAGQHENSDWSIFAKQYASHNFRENAKGDDQSMGFNWVHHFDARTDVGVRLFASQENNKLPGARPWVYLNSSPRSPQVPDYNWDAKVNTNSLTLFGVKKWDKVEFSFDFNRRVRTNDDAYSYDAHTVYSGYNVAGWHQSYGSTNSNTHNQSVSPRLKIEDFLWTRNTLLLGRDWSETNKTGGGYKTNSDIAGQIDYNRYDFAYRTGGTYLRDTYQFSNADRVTVGYRSQSYTQARNMDLSDSNNPTPFPSNWTSQGTAIAKELQYTKEWSPYMTQYVRVSQNFRIPNVDDNSNAAWFDLGGGNWAARLLVPQTSHDLDIGMNYETSRSSSEISYFRSHLRNEIGYDPVAAGNVNFDPTQREGLHLKNRLTLSTLWSVRTNLQYVNAKFTEGSFDGRTVPNVARMSGHLSVDFALSPKETVTVTSRFASSRFMSGDFTNAQPEVAGYAVQDLSYLFREKNWSVVTTVANLANKSYADTGIYKSSYYDPYKLTLYPNPGRHVSVVGRYQF
jgi:iron complex outermembrane receptor protein